MKFKLICFLLDNLGYHYNEKWWKWRSKKLYNEQFN